MSAGVSVQPTGRLGVLSQPLGQLQALLLESLRTTHADVLRFNSISEHYELGIRTVSGDFTHAPSGHRYIVAIAGIPPEADRLPAAPEILP